MLERRDFKPQDGYLAAVDLGSNSFHVLLARLDAGEPRTITRLKFPVQLARDLDAGDRIGAQALAAGRAALARIADRLGGLERVRILAVGTSALRRAANAQAFIDEASALLGVPVRVVSGEDEARLIFRGVVDTLPEADHPRLVFDIGGGSTEFALGRGHEADRVLSVETGCVTLSRVHFAQPADAAAGLDRAVADARAALAPSLAAWRDLPREEVLATSGASEAVVGVLAALGWAEQGISRAALQRLRRHLIESGTLPSPLPGLAADRMEVFPGGLAILLALFDLLGLERARWVHGALQDGLLRELAPLPAGGLRRRTMDALLRRFNVDRNQARRVAAVALALLDQVGGDAGLDDADSQLLEAGALLHDLGLAVATAEHARHGAWLLRHAELRGFSGAERAALVALVRAHRGPFPEIVLRDAGASDRLAVLCVLLRWAVILQPAGPADLPQLGWVDGRLQWFRDDAWRQRHPLLNDRLDADLALLGAVPGLPVAVVPA